MKKILSMLCMLLSASMLLCACNNTGSVISGSTSGSNSTANTGSASAGGEEATSNGEAIASGETSAAASDGQTSAASTTTISGPTTSKPATPTTTSSKNKLYGVGSLLSRKKEVTIAEATHLINSLGVGSVRDVMNCDEVLSDPKTVIPSAADYFHDLYSALKFYGVEVITLNAAWFLPDGSTSYDKVPKRDTTPGSDYMKFLEDYRQTWKTLAKEFPEITKWEMGNEMNHTAPAPMSGGAYTTEEKADITTDMIYYAHKGIKEGNPKAITIFPGMAPVDGIDGPATTKYLTRVYENIKSGKFGSKKTTDFFDAMAWHPYWPFTCPNQEWVEENHTLFRIMQKYGDGNKRVYLTEAGFRDDRNTETDKKQAEWIPIMYDLVQKNMPYVDSLHYYWLFNHGDLDPYGLMNEPKEGYSAKAKGLAYQKMTGGKGDLNRYVIKWEDYKTGDNIALRVAVSASSYYSDAGWGLSQVVDGNTKTPGWTNWYAPGSHDWATSPYGNGAPKPDYEEWVQLTFPDSAKINKVLLYGRDLIDSKYHQINGLPREMYVSVSMDGKKWTKVADYKITPKTYPAGQSYDSNTQPYTISFNAVEAKYVKITFTKLCDFPETSPINTGNNYYVQLHQIEVLKA